MPVANDDTTPPSAAADLATPTPSIEVQAHASVTNGAYRFSDGQIASGREAWIRAGHDPSAFDRAVGTAPPQPALSPYQQAAEQLRSTGITEGEVQQTLARQGLSPD